MENVKNIDACLITPDGVVRIVKVSSTEDFIEDQVTGRKAILACTINGCAIYREISSSGG